MRVRFLICAPTIVFARFARAIVMRRSRRPPTPAPLRPDPSRSEIAFNKEVDHGYHVFHAGVCCQGRDVLT